MNETYDTDSESSTSENREVRNMDSTSYLRWACRMAQIREEEYAKKIHAELALRAGVTVDDYVSPWLKAARLLGSSGIKRFKMLNDAGVESHWLFEKFDLSCVIVTFVRNDKGAIQGTVVNSSKANYERIIEKFENREIGQIKEAA